MFKITINPLEKYLVALSGGPDSAALAIMMRRAKADFICAHVNHGQSKTTNNCAMHQQAAKNLATSLNVELAILTGDAETTNGSEEATRKIRYELLLDLAEKTGRVLVTGHHKDDMTETIMFRLFRGTSIRGLTPMKPYSFMGNVKVWRPFITLFHKHELVEWMEHFEDAMSTCWVYDPDNDNLDVTRNFLRHEIVPLLHSKFPNIDEALINMSALAAEASNVCNDMADCDIARLVVPMSGSEKNAGWLDYELTRQMSDSRIKNLGYRIISLAGQQPTQNHLNEFLKMIRRHDVPGEQQIDLKLGAVVITFKDFAYRVIKNGTSKTE